MKRLVRKRRLPPAPYPSADIPVYLFGKKYDPEFVRMMMQLSISGHNEKSELNWRNDPSYNWRKPRGIK